MYATEKWFLYTALIGTIILLERRLINHALNRLETKYWATR